MGILLAFAPFLAFALVDRFIGPIEALLAGVVVSALLVARDWFRTHRAPKLLEIGTLVLFGGLFLHLSWRGAAWSVIAVRLCVDAGLLAIVLVSLAIRRPFTLQYARDQAPRELWTDPVIDVWLTSTNSHLDGARPIDVLALNGVETVMDAIDVEVTGGSR